MTKLTVNEVAVLVGCSIQSINCWYKFKKENPDNEFAKILPDYEQSGERKTRYWNEDDVFKIVRFKNIVPKGRNGFLASVTQRYRKRGKNGKSGHANS